MPKILPIDDLAPGQWLFLDSKKPTITFCLSASAADDDDDDADGLSKRIRVASQGRYPRGVPHRVLAISFPYVVLAVLQPGGALDGPVIVDIKDVDFRVVSKSYVSAISGFATGADSDIAHLDDDAAQPFEVTQAI
ncbi:MAG: hypothetical protein HOC43_10740 [Planctomycetes bacterium]|jgi:hypothetical protein|nr:hypothetical protein [Planctomycetota bacterium]